MQLFLCGAAILFWELVLIRWMGSTIRIVAYFSNLILLSAFLGLGAGALLTRHKIQLKKILFPALCLCLILGPLLGSFAHGNPDSESEYLWIGTMLSENLSFLGLQSAVVLPYWLPLAACFVANAFVFLIFGQWLGLLFKGFPVLKAYSIEIAGSILGIALFGLVSYLRLPPTLWFCVGLILLLPLVDRDLKSYAVALACSAAALVFCGAFERQFLWSPYYKIKLAPLHVTQLEAGGKAARRSEKLVGYDLTVNSDFHQKILDFHPREGEPDFFRRWRAFYEYPYRTGEDAPSGPILIVGAGTGNDVSAALRQSRERIVAVEIDPSIIDIGTRLHPEKPYLDGRVAVINDDARSFFARTDEQYARVVFGFLDSHTLLSSFSTIRLDNFVYTQESLRRVREILKPGGYVYLTFGSNTPWIHERLVRLLDGVFDQPTKVVGMQEGLGNIIYVNRKLSDRKGPPVSRPPGGASGVKTPTDDWPFLYLKEPGIPGHYRAFLLMVFFLSLSSLLLLPRGERQVRLPYFFLGAGFFLIETSNVVKLALLYGSTWVVNVTVFLGILILILLGNLASLRVKGEPWRLLFGLVVSACIVSYFVSPADLLVIPSASAQGAAAVLLFLGPVFFASLIFARLIQREEFLYPAYGSNLLGAMVGGACEYLSLVLGFRALVLLSVAFYALAYLSLLRAGRQLPLKAGV